MSFFRRDKSSRLKAVYEDDLQEYLKSLGILESVKRGDILCRFCGNAISLESLEVIVPEDGEIKLVCSNKNCLNQL